MDDGDFVEADSALLVPQRGIGLKSEKLFFLREEARMEKPSDLLVPQGGSAKRGLMDDEDVVEVDSTLPVPQAGTGGREARGYVREGGGCSQNDRALIKMGRTTTTTPRVWMDVNWLESVHDHAYVHLILILHQRYIYDAVISDPVWTHGQKQAGAAHNSNELSENTFSNLTPIRFFMSTTGDFVIVLQCCSYSVHETLHPLCSVAKWITLKTGKKFMKRNRLNVAVLNVKGKKRRSQATLIGVLGPPVTPICLNSNCVNPIVHAVLVFSAVRVKQLALWAARMPQSEWPGYTPFTLTVIHTLARRNSFTSTSIYCDIMGEASSNKVRGRNSSNPPLLRQTRSSSIYECASSWFTPRTLNTGKLYVFRNRHFLQFVRLLVMTILLKNLYRFPSTNLHIFPSGLNMPTTIIVGCRLQPFGMTGHRREMQICRY
ncbi:hypothetical protein Y032_0028g1770 [Ancylostoma ceylanicum]|uniref:Uncharacterized protein n=1 Tax=Ancylostoma ceylanicum TaxID=53326 RepID=A0A016UTJ5_9BILA|nr:hypothetical protein Y032_0028g1770 [Ancylostoma ceylanicum]